MQKEKVNTHFSFPLKLDMTDYVEKTLLPQQYQEGIDAQKIASSINGECLSDDGEIDEYEDQREYNLIGVTVHTGNADGGHYYSFIKERNALHGNQQDRWFLFNDAEVKLFDPSQIEAECFGGEMTSKTYDTVSEKYLDFSFEKTNSAYMLFYERCPPSNRTKSSNENELVPMSPSSSASIVDTTKFVETTSMCVDAIQLSSQQHHRIDDVEKMNSENVDESTIARSKCDIDNKNEVNCNGIADDKSKASCSKSVRNVMSKELEEWIWEDNRYFLQDRNIFEHTYFK